MDEVRETAVDVPPEVLGDARAALVVRPGDRLVIVVDECIDRDQLESMVETLRKHEPDLKDRVLFVTGIEQLAVLRGEVPA